MENICALDWRTPFHSCWVYFTKRKRTTSCGYHVCLSICVKASGTKLSDFVKLHIGVLDKKLLIKHKFHDNWSIDITYLAT